MLHRSFFTNKIANRNAGYKFVSEKCPICRREDDSWYHLLLRCTHTEITHLRIARHNKAVRRVVQELLRSITGNAAVLFDVKVEGDAEQLADDHGESDNEDQEDEYLSHHPTPPEAEETDESSDEETPTDTQVKEQTATDEPISQQADTDSDTDSESDHGCQTEEDDDYANLLDRDFVMSDSEEEYTPHNPHQTDDTRLLDRITAPSPSTTRTLSQHAMSIRKKTMSLADVRSMRRDFKTLTGYTGPIVADIAILAGVREFALIPPEQRAQTEVTLIDLTYAGEEPNNLASRYMEKVTHHTPLISFLHKEGFTKIKFWPLVLGSRGWHPHMATTVSHRLHIRPSRLPKLSRDLSQIAWQYLRAIVGTRRRLESLPEHREHSGIHKARLHKKYARFYQA
jgi:hypothetical protein